MQRDTLKEDLQYIANYNLPYEQLKGRSVLVTGATGLIGTLLVRAGGATALRRVYPL